MVVTAFIWNSSFIFHHKSILKYHLWLCTLGSEDASDKRVEQLCFGWSIISGWCCVSKVMFSFPWNTLCKSGSWVTLKSLSILPTQATFLTKLKDKNNHVEPQIFKSSYFNRIIGKEETLDNSIFIQWWPASLPGNCLHVSDIFANPCYYLQRELVYEIK